MGEFFIRTYLETRVTRKRTAADAAEGWGGDAYTLLRGPGGEYTLASLLVWDSGKDAMEFFDAMTASGSVSSEDFLGLQGQPNAVGHLPFRRGYGANTRPVAGVLGVSSNYVQDCGQLCVIACYNPQC